MVVLHRILMLAAAVLLAACETTTIRSAWFDTSYRGGPMKKIVVIASDGTTADSRVFEDIFAQKLQVAGVDGVPGYTTVPPDARRAEGPFAAAVAGTGADGVLMVRLLSVDTRTQVSTVMVPGPMWGPYGGAWGGWGGAWGGFYGGPAYYPATEVNQYDVATVETNLYDVATKRLIWAGTTQTINPSTVPQEAPGFADLMIAQFRARGILPAAK
jgi:hypothetical protein